MHTVKVFWITWTFYDWRSVNRLSRLFLSLLLDSFCGTCFSFFNLLRINFLSVTKYKTPNLRTNNEELSALFTNAHCDPFQEGFENAKRLQHHLLNKVKNINKFLVMVESDIATSQIDSTKGLVRPRHFQSSAHPEYRKLSSK